MTRTLRTSFIGVTAAAAMAPALALACLPPTPLEIYMIEAADIECEVGPCPGYAAYDIGSYEPTYIHNVDLSALGLSEIEQQRVEKAVLHGRVNVAGDFVYDGVIATLVVSSIVDETWG
jgi:hypothetical protein